MSFTENRMEKATGMDLNGDGFVGGQGLESKLERVTHVDFNGDGIIGRLPDAIPGGGFQPMNYGSGAGGYPPTDYNGLGSY